MKTGSSIVLIALAVADSLVLVLGLNDHLFFDGFGIHIETWHEFLCKSYRNVFAVAEYVGVYDLVIFTIFQSDKCQLTSQKTHLLYKKKSFNCCYCNIYHNLFDKRCLLQYTIFSTL